MPELGYWLLGYRLPVGVLVTRVLATGVLVTGVLATGGLVTGVSATGVLTTGVLATGVLAILVYYDGGATWLWKYWLRHSWLVTL